MKFPIWVERRGKRELNIYCRMWNKYFVHYQSDQKICLLSSCVNAHYKHQDMHLHTLIAKYLKYLSVIKQYCTSTARKLYFRKLSRIYQDTVLAVCDRVMYRLCGWGAHLLVAQVSQVEGDPGQLVALADVEHRDGVTSIHQLLHQVSAQKSRASDHGAPFVTLNHTRAVIYTPETLPRL